jgi:DnaJ-class molecular chaperone
MAVKFRNYYEILGVAKTASEDEIKKAFRRLARKHHPDVNPGDKSAEEKFKEINEANTVLSDPEKRRRYDQLGPNYQEGSDFTPPPGWENTRGNYEGSYEDLGDIFGQAGTGYDFSDFFNVFFGTGQPTRAGKGFAVRGRDMETELLLSLRQAHQGGAHSFTIDLTKQCSECEGTGVKAGKICPTCRRSGITKQRKQIEVKIPAGVRNGTVIRLNGLGNPGTGKAPAGDLYLKVKLQPDPLFTIVAENDLQIELPLSPWEAVLGAKVLVPTLDGSVEMTVPPASQAGQQLRLKGQGLLSRDGGRGNQYVKLKVVVPTVLTDKERELFSRLAAETQFNPRQSFAGGRK